MDLSLSDYELVDSFCDLYNLSHVGSDYAAWASSIRYVYDHLVTQEKREYIKSLRWTMSKRHNRPYFFERLVNKVVLKKRTDQVDIGDIYQLIAKIKNKHHMQHCNQPCYSLTGMFKIVNCKCCNSEYFVSQYYDPSELGDSVCSIKCSYVFRLHEKLQAKSDTKLISTRFRRARGESRLQKFLAYLINQQITKRKKINRGDFTWS